MELMEGTPTEWIQAELVTFPMLTPPEKIYSAVLEKPTTFNHQGAAALIPSTPHKQQLKEAKKGQAKKTRKETLFSFILLLSATGMNSDTPTAELQSEVTIENLVNYPARFKGSKRDDVKAFIDAVEIYKDCMHVSDANALKGLPMLLEGFVAMWWQGVKATTASWNLQKINTAPLIVESKTTSPVRTRTSSAPPISCYGCDKAGFTKANCPSCKKSPSTQPPASLQQGKKFFAKNWINYRSKNVKVRGLLRPSFSDLSPGEEIPICMVSITIPDRSQSEVRSQQLEDPELAKIIYGFEDSDDSNLPKWTEKGYFMSNGLIYRYLQDIDSEEATLVVPRQERDRVLHEYHDCDLAAHYGVDRTYRRVSQRYFWIGMKKYIAEYLKNCGDCQKYKVSNQKPAGLVQTAVYA
ncbi:hypothetical protein ILUMI_23183 [Ignelater luminosus]|uniref:Integrase zinc-binding domain-containing protein n=1 Tax=Ignelater luminosus TaxID=2038154 RepID=A0A8K0CFP4_IGNLU|nr:hypothetical protein ILUMI_23183 [Ignelater luminosus]